MSKQAYPRHGSSPCPWRAIAGVKYEPGCDLWLARARLPSHAPCARGSGRLSRTDVAAAIASSRAGARSGARSH
eukprot:2246586-Pleurochrysis_carterae.AAC.1